MPVSCGDPMARFGFDLFRADTDEADSEVCFTNEQEMRDHVERIGQAGGFFEIHLYRAQPNQDWEDEPYEIVTPDDFDMEGY